MSYNKDAMAAYKQYGQSMIAGGGGRNMSGLGARSSTSSMTTAPSGPVDFTTIDTKTGKQTKVATITDYGSDNDDGPTVLYTKAANAATAAGVDLAKAAAKPSVDPKLLYNEPRFNIEQQATKIEDYLRGTAIEDALYEAQGFEKPYTGLYIAEDRPMTEAELQKYKPLIDMADDIMNENITVEELGDMDREDQEAFLRAIGVQGLGPAKRQSSFVGGEFDVATTEEEFVRDLLNQGLTKSDASYWDRLGDFRRQKEEAEEGVVDLSPPEAADQELIPTTTSKPDVAPTVDTTPPAQTGSGLMSRRLDGKDGVLTGGYDFMKPGSKFTDALKAKEADNYDTLFGNAEKTDTPFKGTKVTDMSIAEVIEFTKPNGPFIKYNINKYNKNTTAVGKYQTVGKTLRDLKKRGVLKNLGITDETKFNGKTQDSIAAYLAIHRIKDRAAARTNSARYGAESVLRKQARRELRNEWEGFQKLTNAELDAIIDEIAVEINVPIVEMADTTSPRPTLRPTE